MAWGIVSAQFHIGTGAVTTGEVANCGLRERDVITISFSGTALSKCGRREEIRAKGES
jgi:hypothetical protein